MQERRSSQAELVKAYHLPEIWLTDHQLFCISAQIQSSNTSYCISTRGKNVSFSIYHLHPKSFFSAQGQKWYKIMKPPNVRRCYHDVNLTIYTSKYELSGKLFPGIREDSFHGFLYISSSWIKDQRRFLLSDLSF